jgi:hypothetical protein
MAAKPTTTKKLLRTALAVRSQEEWNLNSYSFLSSYRI